MKLRAYVSALGDEAAIRGLDHLLVMNGTVVKHLTRVKKEHSVTGKAAPWFWKSKWEVISVESIDDDIENLLTKFKGKYQTKGTEKNELFLTLQLIVQYDEDDTPLGMFFSRKNIQLMSELNMALDINPVMEIHDDD